MISLNEWLQSIKISIEFDIQSNEFFAKADMKRKPHLHFYATDTGIKAVVEKLVDDIIESWKEYVVT